MNKIFAKLPCALGAYRVLHANTEPLPESFLLKHISTEDELQIKYTSFLEMDTKNAEGIYLWFISDAQIEMED